MKFQNAFVEVITSRKTLHLSVYLPVTCYYLLAMKKIEFSEVNKNYKKRSLYYCALEYQCYFLLQGLETKSL